MYLYLQHYGCYSFFYSYFVSQILLKKKPIHQYMYSMKLKPQ